MLLCTLVMSNLLRSKIGRAWIAIRDNDIAAEALGVNVVFYKLLAFFVAGFFGGIAGAFWVTSLAAISPEHFQFGWSLWLVGVILIGGVGSIQGTILRGDVHDPDPRRPEVPDLHSDAEPGSLLT